MVFIAVNRTTIIVGGTPFDLAITPDSKYLWVPNGKTITVIDTTTNNPLISITAENNPCGVAITPDGQYAYVTNSVPGNGRFL
jgi:YVTN family beta-propeller protein